MPSHDLWLRPLHPGDEAAVRAAQEVMDAEGHVFALGYHSDLRWSDYLERMEGYRHGVRLPFRWVPSTFLVAEVAGEIVGRTSIRHRLNEFLTHEGGHVGYCVLPAHRGRGYATEILRQSVDVARSLGITRVLVTCEDGNVASATVIERCGGALESVVDGEAGNRVRRYWIC